ncbi:MAG TPA: NAD(P)H-binding protein [Alcanivoracaceae bacterium]|nr:NAD(P)H-binding protein [Alcanivoracaceae bacterium]
MKALVVGATGLIGAQLVQELLADDAWQAVTVFARRPLPLEHEKLTVVEVDFARLSDYSEYFAVDAVFSCLGTTLASAGSKAAFRVVDYDYNYQLAELAAQENASHFLLVSAYGAKQKSLFFYSRVKGELEAAIVSLPLERVTFMQPSLLLGQREERRLAEQAAGRVANIIRPLWRKAKAPWWPIEANNVAVAMAKAATTPMLYRVEHWQYADIMAAVDNNEKEK